MLPSWGDVGCPDARRIWAVAASSVVPLAHRHLGLTARRLLLCAGVAACLPSAPAWAQASLAAEDKIDEVPVTIGGVQESFTVIQDARQTEQWYYVSPRPRLFERAVEGVFEPEFALVRFQFEDPANPQNLLEGGILQFSASLEIPPEAIPQLKDAIAAREGVAADAIRLAALPLESATVVLYTPTQGSMITAQPQGTGIAPTFAAQKMVFNVELSKIGSDVFNELVDGNTGMPVAVEMNYNGLTPPLGFTVEVDWNQTFDFYSRDQEFAAKASYFGLFGASADVSAETIRQSLEQNNCIKIDVIIGSGFTMADADKVIQPLLARINAEIVANMTPPAQITPAQADKPQPSGFFAGAGYSVAIKDVEQVKTGRESFTFTTREVVKRTTIAGGFVGIGRYPEEIREKLVRIVPPGPWDSAFFLLPAVGDNKGLGIDQVDLEVAIKSGDSIAEDSQVVIWRPDEGWKDRIGTPRTVLAFPLAALRAENPGLTDVKFLQKTKTTVGGEVLEVAQEMEVFDGEIGVKTPLNAVEVVAVDGSNLSWRKVDPASDLVFVNARLESGDKSFAAALKPRNVDGNWEPPKPLYWLIDKDGEPVTATIRFGLNDGQIIEWEHNGKNLEEQLSTLEVTLVDGHFQD